MPGSVPPRRRAIAVLALVASLLSLVLPASAAAQAPERKIAEMELLLLGLSATVDPANPVFPKNTDAGVRIVVEAGGRVLTIEEATAFFGTTSRDPFFLPCRGIRGSPFTQVVRTGPPLPAIAPNAPLSSTILRSAR